MREKQKQKKGKRKKRQKKSKWKRRRQQNMKNKGKSQNQRTWYFVEKLYIPLSWKLKNKEMLSSRWWQNSKNKYLRWAVFKTIFSVCFKSFTLEQSCYVKSRIWIICNCFGLMMLFVRRVGDSFSSRISFRCLVCYLS